MPYSQSEDELIVAVDPDSGQAIGSVSKVLAHTEGIWHATIHCWILDVDRRLIFQRRSQDKALWPGRWDISAAGHIRPGEDGLREIKEELGADVTPEELIDVGVLTVDQRCDGTINRERPRVYLWDSGRHLESFTFEDGEVTALTSLSLAQVQELLRGGTIHISYADPLHRHDSTMNLTSIVPLSAQYWEHLIAAITSLTPRV